MASKLLRIAAHEAENQTELTLREDFLLLQRQLKPPFSLKIPSPTEYKQLNRAILFGLLTEPHMGKIHITHLNAIVTDGYAFFVDLLLKISNELYPKLLESSRVQLMWVVSKMVDVSAIGVDGLLVSLLRQIVAGDLSYGNLWLCEELLRVFSCKWNLLLEEQPLVLSSGLYTYLRLLADHYRLSGSSKLEALKHLEIDFCIRVLRQNFHLCLQIGRDLLRLLQDLVHIPEFRDIWKDLLLNPIEFSGVPGFSDISQLYCSRTSSRFLLLRITVEMETQLRFLLTHVRWGSQKRYQAWFVKKFLCGVERETLIIDLVRFICCAHHPSNEIIQSDVIPRWAVIGWLLKCCRKNHVEANVKLALFYDWLFFDERVDKIMNIEPGILLMVNSIPKYIDMTHNLLEFLFLLVDNYDVERKDVIVWGVTMAFGILVRRGVVHSLDTLISCSALSPFLRERLVDIFSRLKLGFPKESLTASFPCHSLPTSSLPTSSKVGSQILLARDLKRPTCSRGNQRGMESVDASGPISDDSVTNCNPLVTHSEPLVVTLENLVENLGESIKNSNILGLQSLEEILFSFENLVNQRLDTGGKATSYSVLRPEILANKITEAFKLNGYKIFAPFECSPSGPNFADDIQSATASITRIFIFSQEERIQELILFWSRNGFSVGARLLFYATRLAHEAHAMNCLTDPHDESSSAKESDLEISLLKCHVEGYVTFTSRTGKDSLDAIVSDFKMEDKLVMKMVDGAFAAYRSFLVLSSKSLHKKADTSTARLLFSDMLSCCEWGVKRRSSLFCSIFCHLSDISTGEEDLISLLVDQVDHADLLVIQFNVGLKRFSVFGEDTEIISHLVKSSLCWSSEKQQKFWNLMRSELAVTKVLVDKVIMDLFCSSLLDPNVHAIAVGGLLTLCSCRAPTPELVGAIVSLPNNKFQDFAAAVLASWAVSNASILFNSLANCVENMNSGRRDCIKINQTSILYLWNFLDMQDIRSINFLNKLSVEFPEIKSKLADAAVL